MATIFLVRHGETEWNSTSRIQGQGSALIPLSTAGRRQAEKAALRLFEEGVSAIYTSDLARAMETAQIIAGILKLPVTYLSELREQDFGLWQGLNLNDVRSRFGPELERYLAEPLTTSIPGGESYGQLYDRATKAIRLIAEASGEAKVLVVSHIGTIRAILCYVLDLDVRNRRRLEIANGSISVVQFADGEWKLLLLNDTSHLR